MTKKLQVTNRNEKINIPATLHGNECVTTYRKYLILANVFSFWSTKQTIKESSSSLKSCFILKPTRSRPTSVPPPQSKRHSTYICTPNILCPTLGPNSETFSLTRIYVIRSHYSQSLRNDRKDQKYRFITAWRHIL